MPRNTLKSFPTGMLRRGLAHFHPGSGCAVQPPIDSPPEPPGTEPVTSVAVPPQASGPFPPAPIAPRAVEPADAAELANPPEVAEAVTPLPVA